MPTTPVLVVVPAFGLPHLTDTVLGDLRRDAEPAHHVVVVDNGGDFRPAVVDERVEVHRPGRNLRWIGAANWALREAGRRGIGRAVVLNNDVRLSPELVARLAATFDECDDVAVAAPCYDDFWLHQRARELPAAAERWEPVEAYRSVPFCDGTAIAFDVAAVLELGALDTVAFPRHGYGADIDLALRARAAGRRCVVAETAYVSHLRRATMNATPGESSERNRAEILTGMQRRHGPSWRARVGLGPGAFPPHNTGSAADWYL